MIFPVEFCVTLRIYSTFVKCVGSSELLSRRRLLYRIEHSTISITILGIQLPSPHPRIQSLHPSRSVSTHPTNSSTPHHAHIMGQAFSGPNAFKWLGFTPKATAVLQANPFYLLFLLIVLVSCIGLGLVAYWIHVVTNRPYAKPKPVKDAKPKK